MLKLEVEPGITKKNKVLILSNFSPVALMSINGSIFSESDERQFGNEPEDCVTAVKIAGITVPNIATKIYEGNEIPPDVTSMKLSEEMVTSGSFNVETSLRSGGHPNTSNWLSRKPKPGTALHFMSVSACVFACYLCYGVLQEMIFTNKELKPYGWFLTWIQFAFYVFFGSCEFMSHGKIIRHVPMSTYLLLAFLTVATMGLSNTSLRYLNYPTQVIFKSCKLIPVMIGGICIQNKRYKMIDYLGKFPAPMKLFIAAYSCNILISLFICSVCPSKVNLPLAK